MLDSETKRRIDAARDTLVGKVPDPKSQVEQITIALIYKFMGDMDAESEELGGVRTFFAGEFARYAWSNLLRSGLGGHETLNLYAEAIARMPENPGIPPLFRAIFKNAYLPYRDPEVLKLFLKVIDEFDHTQHERLGDAFEYLLLVLGSQGDAGQFLTPRHIIDFMIAIIDPRKNETILDPACGTAGFLISAYKHILKTNSDDRGRPTLTPEEKARLARNFSGYDISPDMVRLSLVNLYLHGFNDPHIYEYDTLTSLEKWNETADVILANPPFMSPKGGIRPHNRFSVQSNRSEVLFVDYIAEHLSPTGRAAVIVPEGIIFQSGTAYKKLRQMLVETCLVAVISLPAGVFNPYSGVKTSILILDKSLARHSQTIGFFKVDDDGFSLGTQRNPVEKDDLPEVKEELTKFLDQLRNHEYYSNHQLSRGLIVIKDEIAVRGEYKLGIEGYRKREEIISEYPLVCLGEVAQIISGQSPPGDSYNDNAIGVPFYQGKAEFGEIYLGQPVKWTTNPQKFAEEGDILISVRAPVGPVNISKSRICIGRGLAAIRSIDGKLLPKFAFYILRNKEKEIKGDAGTTFASINHADIERIKIPLPPLDVQREIVAEIESYQMIIDGARAVVDNYRPRIPIDLAWPKVKVGSISKRVTKGTTPTTIGHSYQTEGIRFIKIESISEEGYLNPEKFSHISEACHKVMGRSQLKANDVLFSIAGALGRVTIIPPDILPANTNQALSIITPNEELVYPSYLAHALRDEDISSQAEHQKAGVAQYNLSLAQVSNLELPLPPLPVQQQIVAEIEAEQALVAANRQLITRFQQKIQSVLSRVWGEESSS